MTADADQPARPSPQGDGAGSGGTGADASDGGGFAAGGDGGTRTRGDGLAAGGVSAVGSRWASVALVVSAVAYSSWLLAEVLNPPLNSAASYASELAATDQPWSWLFRGGDLLAGAAALAAGLAMAVRPRCGRTDVAAREIEDGRAAAARQTADGRAEAARWTAPDRLRTAAGKTRLGWWCVAAFGAFTLLDAGLFPMACAPSVDAACAAAEAAGGVPVRHQIHTVTSSLAAFAPLVGMAAFAWARRGFADVLLFASMAAATVVTVVAALSHSWVGSAQRGQLVVVSAWLLWLAVRGERAAASRVVTAEGTRT